MYLCELLCTMLMQVKGEAVGGGVTGCCEPSDVDSESKRGPLKEQ